jgi:hypothetical protein
MALAIGVALLLGLLGVLIVCSGMNDAVPRSLADAPPVPVEPSSVGAASPPA